MPFTTALATNKKDSFTRCKRGSALLVSQRRHQVLMLSFLCSSASKRLDTFASSNAARNRNNIPGMMGRIKPAIPSRVSRPTKTKQAPLYNIGSKPFSEFFSLIGPISATKFLLLLFINCSVFNAASVPIVKLLKLFN